LQKLYPYNESDLHVKDDLIIPRRRACMLTHYTFVEEIEAREENRIVEAEERKWIQGYNAGLRWYNALHKTDNIEQVVQFQESMQLREVNDDAPLVLRFRVNRGVVN
jgi:hypothetical protein